MKTIFVGNLPYSSSEEDVSELFSQHGSVHSAKIIYDRETGRSRGFGFVEMEDNEADGAMESLDGYTFGGRPLRVNEAREKPRKG